MSAALAEDPPEFLTIAEVARRMRVSPMSLYRLQRAGNLPFPVVKLSSHTWRVPRRAYEAWESEQGAS